MSNEATRRSVDGGFVNVIQANCLTRDAFILRKAYVEIINEKYMFDFDTYDTYTKLILKYGGSPTVKGYVRFELKTPMSLSKIIIFTDDDGSSFNLGVYYVDGTNETLSVTHSITVYGNIKALVYVPTGTTEVNYIFLQNKDLSKRSVKIYAFKVLAIGRTIMSSDIEIGAVEIKDADTDTRAKVDDDYALRTGLYDTSGTRINPATEGTLSGIKSQTDKLQFDTDNNLLIYAKNPAIAYNSTNDWFRMSVENDNAGLAKETTLQSILQPLNELVLNNATVDSSGNSDNLVINHAKVVEVLIVVGTPTGSPSITFYLDVLEPTSGKVIKSYSSSNLTAEGTDYIYVANDLLGNTVRVRWDGTLDASNYFSGVFVRVVAKR